MTTRGRSPDGKTVLAGCYNQTPPMPARIWDATTGRPIRALLTHQLPIYSVAYSPDGKTALTGSADQTARLWDVATGDPIGVPLAHQGPVHRVAERKRSAQAEAAFNEAVSARPLDGAVRLERARAVSMPTVDWLPVQVLRREAEAVILYDPVFPAEPFAK